MEQEKREKILNGIDLLDYVIKQGFTAEKTGSNSNQYHITPCPKCKSPKQKSDKGHFEIYKDTNSYSSFSDCCNGGTILDYMEEIEGLSKAEAIKQCENLLGIKNEYRATGSTKDSFNTTKNANTQQESKIDFMEYYNKLKHNDNKPALKYLESRGINKATAEKYSFLFDKDKNSIIFPVSESHYIYRSINKESKGNGTGSQINIFNKSILLDETIKEIFITEGIIDGLSLEKDFISLNSVTNKEKLIKTINKNIDKVKDKLFVLALDNDKAGADANEYIKNELIKLNLKYTEFSFNRKYKDINEYLQAEPDQLKKNLENKTYLKPDLVLNYLEQFKKEILENKKKEAISTGFLKLNQQLDGGFYPGLYAIGAISSLGKTTFIQQITDYMAEKGQDVLFFSLEMSKYEMMAKSLSRFTFENIKTRTESMTTRQILNMEVNPEIINTAILKYKKIADNLSIVEGSFETNLSDIKEKIENYIELTGKKPVVVIDYLQILQSGKGDIGTDKQKIDYLVTELKRISRNKQITLILISSFNRENYMSGVSFESFKESGAIEYTADVVFGLQLKAINNLETEKTITGKRNIINEAKKENPRKLELICLKNRNGENYFKIDYEFYAKYNYFNER